MFPYKDKRKRTIKNIPLLYFLAGILEENRFKNRSKKTDLKKLFFLKTDFLKKPIQNGKPIHEETIDSRIGLSESVEFCPSLQQGRKRKQQRNSV